MGIYTITIKGESYTNSNGTKRQDILHECQPGESIILVREPRNKYDKNAVAVYRDKGHQQLGYTSRKDAEWIARIIDDGGKLEAKINKIIGGEGDKPNLGVLVDVNTTPSKEW